MMRRVKQIIRNWQGPRLWLIGIALALFAVLATAGVFNILNREAADHLDLSTLDEQIEAQAQAFVDRQAAALQPEFQSDLQALAQAPRYTIVATADPQGGTVAGRLSVLYTNQEGGPLNELVFRLYPNASTIYGGGSLEVGGVVGHGAGAETELTQGDTVFTVPLEPALEAGQTISVSLPFTAHVPYGSSRGYGIYNRALGVTTLAGWYPVLALYENGWRTPPVPVVGDAMLAELSLYEVRLTAPAGTALASTGTLIDRREDGEWVTYHVVSGPAREFSAALSERFTELETTVGAVTLRLHALPANNPVTTPEEALNMAAAAVEAYVARYGPYPYTELDVADAAIYIGGYEFPGLVFVEAGKRMRSSVSSYRYLLVHELAHQWWYGLAGTHTVSEPWLDESFATYSAVVYLEYAGNEAAAEDRLAYWQRVYGPRRSYQPPIDSSALDFHGWGAYRRTVYIQGALFLHQLRQEMGDERFYRFLQRYQQVYRYEVGTTEGFMQMAEEVAGQEFDELFETWFGE